MTQVFSCITPNVCTASQECFLFIWSFRWSIHVCCDATRMLFYNFAAAFLYWSQRIHWLILSITHHCCGNIPSTKSYVNWWSVARALATIAPLDNKKIHRRQALHRTEKTCGLYGRIASHCYLTKFQCGSQRSIHCHERRAQIQGGPE